MGVKGFAKVFSPSAVTLKDLKNQTLAVDASLEIYRAILGMESVKGLTDTRGRPTLHVSVILANLVAYKAASITTIWVFDFDPEMSSDAHNPLKVKELEERRARRAAANKKIEKLKQAQDGRDALFSDSDSDSDTDAIAPANIPREIVKQEKIAFTLQPWMVNDIKLILNFLNVKWVEAPRGVEGECLAARLTHEDVAEADAVLSSDADSLLFGANALIKKNAKTKKYDRFYLSEVLEAKDISQTQLIKIGIALGTDMYKDKQKKLFYRIGPKSVVSKVKSGALDERFDDPEVKSAIEHFGKTCDVTSLDWHNADEDEYSDINKAALLIDWLVSEKSFNRARVAKLVGKLVE